MIQFNHFKQKIKRTANQDIQVQNTQLQGIIQLLKGLEQDLNLIKALELKEEQHQDLTSTSSITEECCSNFKFKKTQTSNSRKRRGKVQKKNIKRNDSSQNLLKRKIIFKRKLGKK